MARKKEFDPTIALDKAMNLFWLQGYTATSVDDLCNHMGIKRGSLYDTFGDKHTLFLKALHWYAQKNSASPDELDQLESATQAIRMVFQEMIDLGINDPDCRGCFVVNTITELAASDPEVAEFGENQRRGYEKMFYDLLVMAEQNNEIAPHQDLRAKAQFLVNAIYGLRVTAKVNQNRNVLNNIVDTTLAALR